jgi:uncharacterized peroxidase-related enzyme
MASVTPLPREKAAEEVKPIYDSMTGKFGKMPNFFALMAHRPAVLKSFLPFYGAATGEGSVEPKLKELAYLKTSVLNGCAYWTRAHTASSKRVGVTADQIQALTFYRHSTLFDAKEKAVTLYAERVTRGAAAMREGTLEELRKLFTEEQIVELTLVICAANFTNRFNDALQAEPDLGWGRRRR